VLITHETCFHLVASSSMVCCVKWLNVQVREEAMRSLELSQVTYTSDVLKCTVVKAEGLPLGARSKPCVVEVSYGPVVRFTQRIKPSTQQGIAECAFVWMWNSDESCICTKGVRRWWLLVVALSALLWHDPRASNVCLRDAWPSMQVERRLALPCQRQRGDRLDAASSGSQVGLQLIHSSGWELYWEGHD
jgi:hypothetical protein